VHIDHHYAAIELRAVLFQPHPAEHRTENLITSCNLSNGTGVTSEKSELAKINK
jgi:hypothetical protein